MKPSGDATVPTEGLDDVREHLVGAVAGPHLLGRDRHPRLLLDVCRQRLAQVGELAVGVAVERRHVVGERRDDGVDDDLRHRVGVLVGVEPHRHVELRRAVRRAAAQVGTQQALDLRRRPRLALGHRGTSSPKRAVTASPCAGRSSACASVTTWRATPRSAGSS